MYLGSTSVVIVGDPFASKNPDVTQKRSAHSDPMCERSGFLCSRTCGALAYRVLPGVFDMNNRWIVSQEFLGVRRHTAFAAPCKDNTIQGDGTFASLYALIRTIGKCPVS